MLELNHYNLTDFESSEISKLLSHVEGELTLQSLWNLMDQVWVDLGCAALPLNQDCLDEFYRHPVWTLNGIFIEQDVESMQHRRAFADALIALKPRNLLDFGGGFGTLARIVSRGLPSASINIFEPYPSQCMLHLCKGHQQIQFVDHLEDNFYDILVCTDVLEHVEDPLKLLISMIASVRTNGHLLIANCFEPVIACHLPSTFHLRYSFDDFCSSLGLLRLHSIELPYGAIYRKVRQVNASKSRLRRLEVRSQCLYPFKAFSQRYFTCWVNRVVKMCHEPMYYPRKFAALLRKW